MRKGGLTWDAGAKLVWELGDEVIVDPVLHGSEHDDRPRVVDCDGEEKHTRGSVVPLTIRRTTALARPARLLAPLHRWLSQPSIT